MAINKEHIKEEAISLNNEREVSEFIRQHQTFVFNTAYRFLNSYEDAQEASQDVFIKVINALKDFRGDSSIKTWLYKITKNTSMNYLRKRKIRSIFSSNSKIFNDNMDVDINDNSARPDDSLESSELEAIFLRAVNKLPEKQRETFALRYYENMQYSEISQLIGTSVGGLKANYYQAIKKITSEINEYINS